MPDLTANPEAFEAGDGNPCGCGSCLRLRFISRRWWARWKAAARRCPELQTELTLKTRQVAPLQDLPHKVELANKQITEFYKKSPARAEFADCHGIRETGCGKRRVHRAGKIQIEG